MMTERIRWVAFERCTPTVFKELRLAWGVRPLDVAIACKPPVKPEVVRKFEANMLGTVSPAVRFQLYLGLRDATVQRLDMLRTMLMVECTPPEARTRVTDGVASFLQQSQP